MGDTEPGWLAGQGTNNIWLKWTQLFTHAIRCCVQAGKTAASTVPTHPTPPPHPGWVGYQSHIRTVSGLVMGVGVERGGRWVWSGEGGGCGEEREVGGDGVNCIQELH